MHIDAGITPALKEARYRSKARGVIEDRRAKTKRRQRKGDISHSLYVLETWIVIAS
jgi:hypothetical protein